MCCRSNRACGPPRRQPCAPTPQRRRQPLLLTLGQFAYSKYQQRKDSRALQTPASGKNGDDFPQRRASPPPDVLEQGANDEILERVGVKGPPPRYEDVVDEARLVRRRSSGASSGDSDDTESLSHEPELVGAAGGDGGEKELTRYQQRRAEKMARKAEKAARKADRAAMGL